MSSISFLVHGLLSESFGEVAWWKLEEKLITNRRNMFKKLVFMNWSSFHLTGYNRQMWGDLHLYGEHQHPHPNPHSLNPFWILHFPLVNTADSHQNASCYVEKSSWHREMFPPNRHHHEVDAWLFLVEVPWTNGVILPIILLGLLYQPFPGHYRHLGTVAWHHVYEEIPKLVMNHIVYIYVNTTNHKNLKLFPRKYNLSLRCLGHDNSINYCSLGWWLVTRFSRISVTIRIIIFLEDLNLSPARNMWVTWWCQFGWATRRPMQRGDGDIPHTSEFFGQNGWTEIKANDVFLLNGWCMSVSPKQISTEKKTIAPKKLTKHNQQTSTRHLKTVGSHLKPSLTSCHPFPFPAEPGRQQKKSSGAFAFLEFHFQTFPRCVDDLLGWLGGGGDGDQSSWAPSFSFFVFWKKKATKNKGWRSINDLSTFWKLWSMPSLE